MSKALLELVKKQFGAAVLGTHSQFGDDTVVVEASRWVDVHRFLRDDPAADMAMLIDLCAVDYPDREPRFEVVTHLRSVTKGHRLRVKTLVGDSEGEGAEVGTLVELWGAANWYERETWDMMGIKFLGHPDPRRILTYPEFEGHPLRKDYPANRTQPLVPYREGPDILDKLAPFGLDEGMPFGRQTHSGNRPSLGPKVPRMEPIDQDLEESELELPSEPMKLNMGPAHPAMHGTVRIILELSGETVNKADVQIGYLHRGFEKMCERGTWTQCFPYIDRLNYVSPMLNNNGFAMAVEKLLGIKVPERCEYYRVILGELARISDHLTCNGASAMELGAFTPFLWFIKARDFLWDIFEEETGARLTHSFGRVGGMAKPPTPQFKDHVRAALKSVMRLVTEGESLILKNRIFLDRLEGVGRVTPELALSHSWTGPCLRSTGVAYDVRKAHPYSVYDRFDFDVPVGTTGDNYDRFMIRLEELRQSVRIVEQALAQMPDEGPINVEDPRVVLPPKDEVYTTIEATIQHFKIVMEGIKVPAGECYSYSEGGNGELGFYLVSDGSGTPYRVRIRPPSFILTSALHHMIEGGMIADIVPTFGSVNMIGGECDH